MSETEYEEERAPEEIMAIAYRVCARMSEGALARDCYREEHIDGMTWWKWCEDIKPVRLMFERARRAQAQSMAEYAVTLPKSIRGEDHHIVAAVRLEVDTLRWYTSKIAPKIFGDRLEVGGDGFRIGVIALPSERAETSAEDGASLGPQSAPLLKSGTDSGDAAG